MRLKFQKNRVIVAKAMNFIHEYSKHIPTHLTSQIPMLTHNKQEILAHHK